MATAGGGECCRAETHELYVREGKEDRLGPSGVPESLQNWLAESRQRMLEDAITTGSIRPSVGLKQGERVMKMECTPDASSVGFRPLTKM